MIIWELSAFTVLQDCKIVTTVILFTIWHVTLWICWVWPSKYHKICHYLHNLIHRASFCPFFFRTVAGKNECFSFAIIFWNANWFGVSEFSSFFFVQRFPATSYSQLLSFLLLGPFFCQHWSMLQESGPFYLLFYFSLVIVGENLMVWFQSIDITDGILFLGYMRLFLWN